LTIRSSPVSGIAAEDHTDNRKRIVIIEHGGKRPKIAQSAYVAPTAVVRGDVRIGSGTAVLFGAVVTAEGGAVEIGSDCVIMENAVVRGTPRNPVSIGNRVLVGPRAHLSGCQVQDDSFLATGATVFNGAIIEESVEVRVNGVVHVNTRLTAGSVVPIGWVAVGDPGEAYPPSEHDRIWEIQRGLDFPGTVWGVDRAVPKGERTKRYAKALARQRADRIIK
jgi:carbonic anhydrase/acetyltransferase-like protein (isoleucine patch superfamily)